MPKCSVRPYQVASQSSSRSTAGQTTSRPSSWCCCCRRGRPSRPRARQLRPEGRAPHRRPRGWRPALDPGSQCGRSASQPSGRCRPAAGPAAPCVPARARPTRRSRPATSSCASRPRSTSLRVWAITSGATSKLLVRVEAEDLLGGGHLAGAEAEPCTPPVFIFVGAGSR